LQAVKFSDIITLEMKKMTLKIATIIFVVIVILGMVGSMSVALF
jgi:hypothetical protein